MIVDYILIGRQGDVLAFTNEIRSFIAKGWEPQGGVNREGDGSFTYYCQAMIRRGEQCDVVITDNPHAETHLTNTGKDT